MGFIHDTTSKPYFKIGPLHIKANGRTRNHSELIALRDQMQSEGIPENNRYELKEDGIEALSKTALNLDHFYVYQCSSLGYFTL